MITSHSEAGEIILSRLDDERCFFVFPSESAAQAYACAVLDASGTAAVRLDRFIAWDTFKQNAIKAARSVEEGAPRLKSVTPLMRRLFAARVLEENARLGSENKTPLFTALIPADFARYSSSFVSWVADLLPRLMFAAEAPGQHIYRGDLVALRALYEDFLHTNSLFESAWERPPFKGAGRMYFIFYPETLMDFAGYEPLLRQAEPDVRLVPVPARTREPRSFFYKNAQSEITEAALYILNLNKQGVSFSGIIVSSPSLNEYEPYIEKEFTNRGIPFVNRNGKNLSGYPAGRLFKCIQNCYTKRFSFAAVVNLLTNRALPWKEQDQINKLIDFGLANGCVCSWEEADGETVDVWKNARLSPEDVSVFYTDLKNSISALCRAKTFAGVKRRYFAFRDRFLNMDAAQTGPRTETGDVISRCVSELAVLAELEKMYPALKNDAPYAFWTRLLDETIYTPQTHTTGVTLLPYRIAAAVPAAYHIVLGAEQNGMAQINTRAGLLSTYLPGAAGTEDEKTGEIFFNLHNATARKEALFFCAEETFSGFAIPFSLLDVSKPRTRYRDGVDGMAGLFFDDLVSAERMRFASIYNSLYTQNEYNKNEEIYPKTERSGVHLFQKEGFEAFAARNMPQEGHISLDFGAGGEPAQMPAKRYGGVKDGQKAFFVSESALKPFYECSLKWLFSRVLAVKELDMEARVFDPFIWGDVCHLILSEFFIYMKNEDMTFDAGGAAARERLFETALDAVFDRMDERVKTSEIKKTLMRPQKETARKRLLRTLGRIAAQFEGYGVLLSEEKLDCRFTYEGSPCEINGYDIYIDGKPDLVLTDGSGNLAILDFKSAALPSKESCFGSRPDGMLLDFQMPVYHALLEKERGVKAETGCFVNIRDAEVKIYFSPQGGGGRAKTVSFDETAALLEQQILTYAKSALSCDIEPYISKQYNTCILCTYKHICRKTYTIKRGFYGS